MHSDIEVSNEDIEESDVEDGETIEEGGTQSAYLEKWKFSSSADEGSFSKICRIILHPILFRGQRDNTETPTIKKLNDYYTSRIHIRR